MHIFGEMSIRVFSPYFDWVIRFCFLLLNCRAFLYVLEITRYQIYGLQIFSVIPEVALKFGWLFSLLYWSFPVWGSSILFYFDFVACAFGVMNPRNHYHDKCHEDFPLCFHLGVLQFWVFKYFNSFWVYKHPIHLSLFLSIFFFKCRYSIFPTSFTERTLLSPLCILGILIEISWLCMCRVTSGLSMLFHWSTCLSS